MEIQGNKDEILILAGDIGIASKAYTISDFLEEVSSIFRKVFWIPGNHEHYHGNFPTTVEKMEKLTEHFPNIVAGNQIFEVIDNVAFIGATLWTDMDNMDVLTLHNAKLWMSDFQHIRTGPDSSPWLRKLDPLDTVEAHNKDRRFILDSIKLARMEGLVPVVFTHHSPCRKSIAPEFERNALNGAYVSDMEEDILMTEPALWVHGHMHRHVDYKVGKTRIVCNPRGYFNIKTSVAEPTGFNPNFMVEL